MARKDVADKQMMLVKRYHHLAIDDKKIIHAIDVAMRRRRQRLHTRADGFLSTKKDLMEELLRLAMRNHPEFSDLHL